MILSTISKKVRWGNEECEGEDLLIATLIKRQQKRLSSQNLPECVFYKNNLLECAFYKNICQNVLFTKTSARVYFLQKHLPECAFSLLIFSSSITYWKFCPSGITFWKSSTVFVAYMYGCTPYCSALCHDMNTLRNIQFRCQYKKCNQHSWINTI